MIRTTLLAAGAVVALAAPALARPPAFAPIGYGAHGVASICAFNLGRRAMGLAVPERIPLAARVLGRRIATVAAAQHALAVNAVRLRSCQPIRVSRQRVRPPRTKPGRGHVAARTLRRRGDGAAGQVGGATPHALGAEHPLEPRAAYSTTRRGRRPLTPTSHVNAFLGAGILADPPAGAAAPRVGHQLAAPGRDDYRWVIHAAMEGTMVVAP